MLRRETKISLYTFFIDIHERCQDQARRALGDRAYQRLFEEGSKLAFEQALLDLLKKRDARRLSDPMALLTRREREIAELVAKGMKNQQIASALVISPRTAESHIQNILSKLGLNSRHEITAWITEKRPESTNSR